MDKIVIRTVIHAWIVVCLCAQACAREISTISVYDLPKEARDTLLLIQQGGPFPYEQDGKVFGNYEKKLPNKNRGYYQEFTVKHLRARHRGTRRIIVGGKPPPWRAVYYTSNHYKTFWRITDINSFFSNPLVLCAHGYLSLFSQVVF